MGITIEEALFVEWEEYDEEENHIFREIETFKNKEQAREWLSNHKDLVITDAPLPLWSIIDEVMPH